MTAVPSGSSAPADETNVPARVDKRGDPHQETSIKPDVELVGGTTKQRRWLAEALNRFGQYGFALPDMTVQFVNGDNDSLCDGYLGLFKPDLSSPVLLVCSDLEFVVAHELAHAWLWANLDTTDRKTYADHRNFSTWNDKNARWADRAAEDAAFVIQQTLMIERRPDSPAWRDRCAALNLLMNLAADRGDQQGSLSSSSRGPHCSHSSAVIADPAKSHAISNH